MAPIVLAFLFVNEYFRDPQDMASICSFVKRTGGAVMTTYDNLAVHEVDGEYLNRRLRSLDPASFDRQISRSRHRGLVRGFALGAILGATISWAAVNVPLPFMF